jgi:hypothetical protein
MTAGTLHRFPGNFTIMAFPTKLPVHNLLHVNVVGPCLHLKDCWMAHLAFKLHTMEPMGKNDRWHAPLFRFAV